MKQPKNIDTFGRILDRDLRTIQRTLPSIQHKVDLETTDLIVYLENEGIVDAIIDDWIDPDTVLTGAVAKLETAQLGRVTVLDSTGVHGKSMLHLTTEVHSSFFTTAERKAAVTVSRGLPAAFQTFHMKANDTGPELLFRTPSDTGVLSASSAGGPSNATP